MPSIGEMRERQAAIMTEIESINNAARDANTALTEENLTTVTSLQDEYRNLDRNIVVQQKQRELELERQQAELRTKQAALGQSGQGLNMGEIREQQKIINQFSFRNAIHAVASNQPLTGLNAEVYQEAEKEFRASGGQAAGEMGNVMVPSFMVHGIAGTERRDLDASTATKGPETIQTTLAGHFDALRIRPMVEMLGATVLRNLRDNIDFSRQTQAGSTNWATEVAAAAEAQQLFDNLSLRPKRITGWTPFSRLLLIQSASIDVEMLVRRDLTIALQTAIDAAAINGSGVDPVPKGILQYTAPQGVGVVTAGDEWPSFLDVVDLETKISAADADFGRMGYLTTPEVRGFLKTHPLDASSSGIMTWTGVPSFPTNGEVNGFRAVVSNNVPKNLGVGTNQHAMIFGNWESLYIGMWGGISLIVDQYTKARNAQIEVTITSFADIGLRYPQSFSYIKDITPGTGPT